MWGTPTPTSPSERPPAYWSIDRNAPLSDQDAARAAEVRKRVRIPRAHQNAAPNRAYVPEIAAGGLWLWGPEGCGKTHLAYGIALAWDIDHVATAGGGQVEMLHDTALICDELEMVRRIAKAERSYRDEGQTLAQYVAAPLLVIDDAGIADPVKDTYFAWSRVLKARSEYHRPTLVTSRLSIGDFSERFCRAKRSDVNSREAGRLGELLTRCCPARSLGRHLEVV